MNYCKLCGAELAGAAKIKSHILTNSQYISPLSRRTNKQLIGFSPDGEFNPCHIITDNTILCKKCDNSLNLYEGERKKLLDYLDSNDCINQAIVVPKINGELVKLACLADLYRCSITNISQFRDILLGNKHEYAIANILKAGHSHRSEYPVLFAKLRMPLDFMAVHVPYRVRIAKMNYYRVAMPGGIIWLAKVDSRDNDYLNSVSVDSISGSAKAVIITDNNLSNKVLLETVRSMR